MNINRIFQNEDFKIRKIKFCDLISFDSETRKNDAFIATSNDNKYYLRLFADGFYMNDVDIIKIIDERLSVKFNLRINSICLVIFLNGIFYYSDITNYITDDAESSISTEYHDMYELKNIKIINSLGNTEYLRIMILKMNRNDWDEFFTKTILHYISSFIFEEKETMEKIKSNLMSEIDLIPTIGKLKKKFIEIWNSSPLFITSLKEDFIQSEAPIVIERVNGLIQKLFDHGFYECDYNTNCFVTDFYKFTPDNKQFGIVFCAKIHSKYINEVNTMFSNDNTQHFKYCIAKMIFAELAKKDREFYIFQKIINLEKMIVTKDHISTYFVLDNPKYKDEQHEIISKCLNEYETFQVVIDSKTKMKDSKEDFYIGITADDLFYIFDNEIFNSMVVKESPCRFRIKDSYKKSISFSKFKISSEKHGISIDIDNIGSYYIDGTKIKVEKVVFKGIDFDTMDLWIKNKKYTIMVKKDTNHWYYISNRFIEDIFFDIINKKLYKINPFILKSDLSICIDLREKYLSSDRINLIKEDAKNYFNEIWDDKNIKSYNFDSVIRNRIEQLFNEIDLDEITNIVKGNSSLLISGLITSKPKIKKDRTIDNRTEYPNIFYIDASLNSKGGSVSVDTLKKFIIKRKKYVVSYLYNFLFDNCPEANDMKDFITIDSMVITIDYRLHVIFCIKQDKIQEVS